MVQSHGNRHHPSTAFEQRRQLKPREVQWFASAYTGYKHKRGLEAGLPHSWNRVCSMLVAALRVLSSQDPYPLPCPLFFLKKLIKGSQAMANGFARG